MTNLCFHVLIGYYVPKSDGEFYQFCYVTHAGDIRGASTPFQFRTATPTEDLLTVTEDDSNSDILVVTTKTGLLEVHLDGSMLLCVPDTRSVAQSEFYTKHLSVFCYP